MPHEQTRRRLMMPKHHAAMIVLLGALLAGAQGTAFAHDAKLHARPLETGPPAVAGTTSPATKTRVEPPSPPDAFLGGRIGGDFDLTDQHGARRRLADFSGRHVLLFFGYANCEAICSAAMPLMAAAIDQLGKDHPPVELVMITVDPERDTQAGLKSGMQKYDPRFIGLTGPRNRLESVWKAFGISISEVARDWNDEAILSHGSFVYLIGRDGKVATLLPPVLAPQQMAKIIRSYF